MIWICLYNIVVVVIFAHLAVHFNNIWLVLLALLFAVEYKKSYEQKDEMNEFNKQRNDD